MLNSTVITSRMEVFGHLQGQNGTFSQIVAADRYPRVGFPDSTMTQDDE